MRIFSLGILLSLSSIAAVMVAMENTSFPSDADLVAAVILKRTYQQLTQNPLCSVHLRSFEEKYGIQIAAYCPLCNDSFAWLKSRFSREQLYKLNVFFQVKSHEIRLLTATDIHLISQLNPKITLGHLIIPYYIKK